MRGEGMLKLIREYWRYVLASFEKSWLLSHDLENRKYLIDFGDQICLYSQSLTSGRR